MKPKKHSYDGIPGVETERVRGSKRLSVIFSLFISIALFCLLPLSELFVRTIGWFVLSMLPRLPPPTPKSKMEEKLEKDLLAPNRSPSLGKAPLQLETLALDAT